MFETKTVSSGKQRAKVDDKVSWASIQCRGALNPKHRYAGGDGAKSNAPDKLRLSLSLEAFRGSSAKFE